MVFNENNLIIDGMIKVIQFGQDPNWFKMWLEFKNWIGAL